MCGTPSLTRRSGSPLEAAGGGHGIALGWRHFIEPLPEAGTLVALGGGFVEFDRTYYGMLTAKGRRKPLARRSLDFLQPVRRT